MSKDKLAVEHTGATEKNRDTKVMSKHKDAEVKISQSFSISFFSCWA